MTGRRWILPALSALLMVLAAVAWGIPWLTRDHADTTSTPTPPAFSTITPIVLKPGAKACENFVALATDTRVAVVLSAKFEGTGPPLKVVASAPGYVSTSQITGGYRGLEPLSAAIEPPARDAIGTVCVTNEGTKPTQLQGTTEGRIQNRSATSVDDVVIPAKMSLLLTEGTDSSVADRPGEILDRISAFKPPIVGQVSLAILFVLVIVGAPVAVLYAIWRGIAAPDPDEDDQGLRT